MPRERLVGQAFVGKRVNLADAEYVDCDFTSCTLIVDGRPILLDGSIFLGGNRWTFEGGALETLKLLRRICRSPKTELMSEMLIAEIFDDLELAKQFTALRRQRQADAGTSE